MIINNIMAIDIDIDGFDGWIHAIFRLSRPDEHPRRLGAP